jgi:hypothetical protein
LTQQGLQPGGERRGRRRDAEREKRRERGRVREGRGGTRRTESKKGRGKGCRGGDGAKKEGRESTELVASTSATWHWEDEMAGRWADESVMASTVPVLDGDVLEMLFD